ncbi:hypothetical protein HK405_002655, partial [Cladochytrium tenue]
MPPHNLDTYCFAYSPPGSIASITVNKFLETFVTSVVLGDDVVPRISRRSVENLKNEVVDAVRSCRRRKIDVIGSFVLAECLGVRAVAFSDADTASEPPTHRTAGNDDDDDTGNETGDNPSDSGGGAARGLAGSRSGYTSVAAADDDSAAAEFARRRSALRRNAAASTGRRFLRWWTAREGAAASSSSSRAASPMAPPSALLFEAQEAGLADDALLSYLSATVASAAAPAAAVPSLSPSLTHPAAAAPHELLEPLCVPGRVLHFRRERRWVGPDGVEFRDGSGVVVPAAPSAGPAGGGGGGVGTRGGARRKKDVYRP